MPSDILRQITGTFADPSGTVYASQTLTWFRARRKVTGQGNTTVVDQPFYIQTDASGDLDDEVFAGNYLVMVALSDGDRYFNVAVPDEEGPHNIADLLDAGPVDDSIITQVQALVQQARAWAESETAPGEPGTKSAKTWAAEAGDFAAAAAISAPFATISALASADALTNGATYRVNAAHNGEPEDFTYDAGSALTADGALIVTPTGMGSVGRLISTRTVYADWEEFDADPRNLEVGIELSVLNVGGYLTVSSGESFETSGGNKVKVKKLPWGWYSTVQFGAACDGATDDYAAMQAAVDAGKADKVKVFHPGLSYISQAVRVDKAWLEGGSSDSGIIVTGEYDGIILTGIHDGSIAGFDQRPAVRNMTIWSSGTQTTANAGLRLGDDTNQLVLAGFLVEGVSFKRVNNSGRSAASALVCAEGASTGYAFIGAIRDISVHRWRHPFHGTKAVNNIIFDGWNQSGCSQSFRIGDVRGVTITGFESGSNQYRAMDIGDCQGLTIIEPYLEDNFRDADLGGSKYDILISALAAQGFRRDHPFNSIRIIGGTFNKSATGSGNCVGAILWASSEGVVIDGASIGGYVESVRVNSLAVNKGVIKNLQKSPSVHAAVPDPIIGALADVQYWPASTPPKFMNERLTETNGTPGPISVAAGAQTSFAVSVSGLTKSDYLMSWRCGATLRPGLIVTAHTHTDEVRFSVFNPTGGTIAVSAATWTVLTGPSGIYA